MIPIWFLYVGGFSMLLLGIMQISMRPHERGDSIYRRFANVGTLWSLCCITVGVALLAMALGYWEGPLGAMHQDPPAKPTRHRRR